jgi:hypothetical protein
MITLFEIDYAGFIVKTVTIVARIYTLQVEVNAWERIKGDNDDEDEGDQFVTMLHDTVNLIHRDPVGFFERYFTLLDNRYLVECYAAYLHLRFGKFKPGLEDASSPVVQYADQHRLPPISIVIVYEWRKLEKRSQDTTVLLLRDLLIRAVETNPGPFDAYIRF